MNAKQIADIIARAPQQVEQAMRSEIPRKAAVIAKNHFRQNFRDGGFTNGGLHPWKKTRRQEAGSPYKPLTSATDNLMRSIDAVVMPGAVMVTNPRPYAAIHNEGGNIGITPKMRRYAWHMVYSLAKVKKGQKMPKELPPMAQAWRAMALTRKMAIHIPRRQFIGTSHELNVKIRKMILNTLIEIGNGIDTR